MKTYTECIQCNTFIDRYRYLALHGQVGAETFGYNRYLNQVLYKSKEWRDFRWKVIRRDNGCDLAMPGYDIFGKRNILIHHINPITLKDVYERNPMIFDLENVICVTHDTHNAIHYGNESLLYLNLVERKPGDTKLW